MSHSFLTFILISPFSDGGHKNQGILKGEVSLYL
jgi:hypothetical protein